MSDADDTIRRMENILAEIRECIDRLEARERAEAERLEIARRLIADTPRDLLAYHLSLVHQQHPKKSARDRAASRWGQPVLRQH
jgi:hypothetical protein